MTADWQILLSDGSKLDVPPTSGHLLAAQQEPYKKEEEKKKRKKKEKKKKKEEEEEERGKSLYLIEKYGEFSGGKDRRTGH